MVKKLRGQVTSISVATLHTPARLTSLGYCLSSLFDSLVKLQIERKLKFILHLLFLLCLEQNSYFINFLL